MEREIKIKISNLSFEEIQEKGWDFFDVTCNLGLNRIDGNTNNRYPLGDLSINTEESQRKLRSSMCMQDLDITIKLGNNNGYIKIPG